MFNPLTQAFSPLKAYACDVCEVIDVPVAFAAVWKDDFLDFSASGVLPFEKAVGFMHG
jgi:hypothetical protein